MDRNNRTDEAEPLLRPERLETGDANHCTNTSSCTN